MSIVCKRITYRSLIQLQSLKQSLSLKNQSLLSTSLTWSPTNWKVLLQTEHQARKTTNTATISMMKWLLCNLSREAASATLLSSRMACRQSISHWRQRCRRLLKVACPICITMMDLMVRARSSISILLTWLLQRKYRQRVIFQLRPQPPSQLKTKQWVEQTRSWLTNWSHKWIN